MTILVGYVPDEFGERALARAVEESQRRRVKLVVVNSSKGDATLDARRLTAEGEVAIRQRLEAAGLDFDIRSVVELADPADELVQIADETKADLIIIGLPPHSRVGKLIVGSTAQRVLLRAHCDVLAVKASGA